MAQMAPGSDYTTIETYFSVPTGSGQNVKPLLGSCLTDMKASANIQGVIQRLL